MRVVAGTSWQQRRDHAYKGRSVLVAGGAGFIGSHLVEDMVAGGARVSVLDNLSTGRLDHIASVLDRVKVHRADLLDMDLPGLLASERPDLIVHLAANALVPDSVERPRWDCELNLTTTLNLLDAMREASPESVLVHASSALVYGEGTGARMREEDATFPVSPYGVSKLAAERYVAVYARLYELRAVNVRLFSTYGPRLRKQVVYDLMHKVHDNPHELFIWGDGTQVRDLNHISNVIEALRIVIDEGELAGEVYNVAADDSISIGELAEMICERMGADPRFVYSGEVRLGDTQRVCADTTKIKTLGYTPRVGISEGLSDTVDWFQREAEAVA